MPFPIIALAVTAAISAASKIASSSSDTSAIKKQAKYDMQIAELNQRTIAAEVDNEVSTIHSRYRRIRGTQKVAMVRSGVTLDGSMRDIITDTNIQEDLDVMSMLYKGKQAVLSEQFRSNMSLAKGSNASRSNSYNAAGSIISSAADFYSKYPTLKT
jgi:hypothetical protein